MGSLRDLAGGQCWGQSSDGKMIAGQSPKDWGLCTATEQEQDFAVSL